MRQLILAVFLVALPVAIFAGGYRFLAPEASAQTQAGLGDLSKFVAIVADVQTIAAGGDFTAAEQRVRDYESAWDQAETGLRPLDRDAWGVIDEANDGAFSALRAATPNAATIAASLQTVLDVLKSGGRQ
ncbi:hypothetical protein [Devosia sp.]|uniref:hypothetical protein n=1 Tax=Devosia sp. TaxID=1871048 RepID=UPI001AC8054F|nr:hypothetical protein [Devosia sp.]MBN9310917.1 hypothetical protein [Devosia sp.]